MSTRPMTTAATLSAVALLALTSACGSKDQTSSASSTSTTSSTTTSTPSAVASASDSTSPMDSASATATASDTSSPMASASSADASASSTGSASGTHSESQLAAMLKGVQVDGKALTPAGPQMVKAVEGGNSDKVTQAIKQAQVTPASCKQAILKGTQTTPGNAPAAVSTGSGMSPMVVLRSMPSADAAKAVISQARATMAACPSYSMVTKAAGQTFTAKVNNQELPLQASSATDPLGMQTSTVMAGRTTKTSSAVASVGDVLVQVTYNGTKPATAAQLSQALEAVAKSVAAKQ